MTARDDDEVDDQRMAAVMDALAEVADATARRERVRLPVEMWNQGTRFSYRVRSQKALRRVVVDPRAALPEERRANNRWPR